MKKLLLILMVCMGLFVGCSGGIVNSERDITSEDKEYIEQKFETMMEINESISENMVLSAIDKINGFSEGVSSDIPVRNAVSTVLTTYYNEIMGQIDYDEYLLKSEILSNIFSESAIKEITMTEEAFDNLNTYLKFND